ncbi:MAG: hypothetical protein IJD70_05545 [Clostridia bacterium]|nr:hypothetical protein [Clostridia bacterium]
MRIAVLTTSKLTAACPDNTIPESCTEILTDNHRIRQFAENKHIRCSEVPPGDAVEKAEYVIILCNKKASRLGLLIGKCNRFKRSFEVVIIE